MAKEEINIQDEAAAENAAPRSKKDSYMEGFKQRHPDWADDDEEGFYGALADDDAARDEEMNGYRSREEEMATALGSSPMNAALFMDAANGKPIPLALLERFPEEVQSFLQDPSNAEALKQTFEAHAAKVEQNKKLQAEAEANLEESNRLLDEMVSSGECSEDDINTALEKLGAKAAGLMVNHIEKEWILDELKSINHDTDVEAAKAQGQIEGRNQKITAQRRDANKGGMNHAGLGTSNAGMNATAPLPSPRKKRGGDSMWEGMKTNKLE